MKVTLLNHLDSNSSAFELQNDTSTGSPAVACNPGTDWFVLPLWANAADVAVTQ